LPTPTPCKSQQATARRERLMFYGHAGYADSMPEIDLCKE
jgi:hypothetical protein